MTIELHSRDLEEISSRARLLALRLRLPLARRNWRGFAGEHQGQDAGSSLDFQDHRSYIPGDDPRHINWQAYARTGQYSMKLFREEIRPLIDLLIDASSSMTAFPDKRLRFLEMSYFLTHAALLSGASVRFHLLRGASLSSLPSDAMLSHQWIKEAQAMPERAPATPLPLTLVPFRSHSMRILLSDLLFPGEPLPLLQALVNHHGFGAIFALFSPSEATPVWSGNYEMIDPEAATPSHRRIDARLLTRYQEAYRQHFALWKQAALKNGFPLARVDASASLSEALQSEAMRYRILEVSA